MVLTFQEYYANKITQHITYREKRTKQRKEKGLRKEGKQEKIGGGRSRQDEERRNDA